MKTCRKCNQGKPVSEFGRSSYYLTRGIRDGKNIYCKPCARAKVYQVRAVKWTSAARFCRCGRWLTEDCFGPNKAKADGRSGQCRECHSLLSLINLYKHRMEGTRFDNPKRLKRLIEGDVEPRDCVVTDEMREGVLRGVEQGIRTQVELAVQLKLPLDLVSETVMFLMLDEKRLKYQRRADGAAEYFVRAA